MRKVWCTRCWAAGWTPASPIPARRRCISWRRWTGCPGMRCVLGLQENVVTGAADGYARMAGQAGGDAAALRAGVGERAGQSAQRAAGGVADRQPGGRPGDVPSAVRRAADGRYRGVGAAVSLWMRTARGRRRWGRMRRRACRRRWAGIATLILPSDTCWDEGGVVAPRCRGWRRRWCRPRRCSRRRAALRSGETAMLILGGRALRAEPLAVAQADRRGDRRADAGADQQRADRAWRRPGRRSIGCRMWWIRRWRRWPGSST